MLKQIRILLVLLFLLALGGAAGLYFYNYTHEDTSPPVFRSDADVIEVSVLDPEETLLHGLYAYDNVDGDISANIRVTKVSTLINETDATVSYIVFGEASNYAVCSRTVRYLDYTPPRFSLRQPLVFNLGETVSFKDSIIVTDKRDGNISGRLKLEETTVVNNTPGAYRAVFSATNKMGDTVYLPLTVQITENSFSRPKIELTSYLIYIPQGERPLYRRFVDTVTDPLSDSDDKTVPISKVAINSAGVDPSTPGVYEAYYYYTGISGEVVTAILTIIVE